MSELSILVPSRGRLAEMGEMIESARHPDVEVLVVADDDDPLEYEKLALPLPRKGKAAIGGGVVVFRRPRATLVEHWNWLAEAATGRYLQMGNDDMRFVEPIAGWLDRLATVPADEGWVIGCNMGMWHGEHFDFPAVTRQFYRAAGVLTDPELKSIYCDTTLYDIGVRARRLKYFGDYYIEHLHWSEGTREVDAVDKDPVKMAMKAGSRPLYEKRARWRIDIAARIANH